LQAVYLVVLIRANANTYPLYFRSITVLVTHPGGILPGKGMYPIFPDGEVLELKLFFFERVAP
jgi:hypothetical protein